MNRQIHALGLRPDRLERRVGVTHGFGQARREHDALVAEPGATFHFLDRPIDIKDRQNGQRDQPVGDDTAVFHDPIVIGPDAGQLQRRVLAVKTVKIPRHAGIEDLDLNAVSIHVGKPRLGVPGPTPFVPGEVFDGVLDDCGLPARPGEESLPHGVRLMALEANVEPFLTGRILDEMRPPRAQLLGNSFPGRLGLVDV